MYIPSVQNYAVRKVLNFVSGKIGTTISYSDVRITSFNRVRFNDLLIYDDHRDTLLYAKKSVAVIPVLQRLVTPGEENNDVIRRLSLDKAFVNLQIDSTHTINLQFIINYLNSRKDTTNKTPPKPFRIKDIQLTDSRFVLHNVNGGKPSKGIDFSNMRLHNMNIHVRDLNVLADTVRMNILHLSFVEHSGFKIEKFTGKMDLCSSHLNFDDIKGETRLSLFSADKVHMSFGSFKDYGTATLFDKVNFDIALRNSRVNTADIGYFTDFFWNNYQEFQITGDFRGPLSSFKGNDLLLKWGRSSVIKGNFNISNLPDIPETFLIFDLKELNSSVGDVEALNIPGNHRIILPEYLKNLSNFRYQGNFTGFFKDFVAHGKLTTNLGEVVTDLMFSPDSTDQIHFSGKLKTKDFKIGKVLHSKLVDGISMDAEIKGSFSKKNSLVADIQGKVNKLTLNNYSYHNISVNGTLSNKRFNGQINVNDPNLVLEFDGLVDMSTRPRRYNFKANVIDANLHALNITKKIKDYHASVLIKANARGNSLDDLNGEVDLLNSLFTKGHKQIQVYDFSLTAHNSEDLNELMIRSDLVDADINGHYKLSELKDDILDFLSCYAPSLIENRCTGTPLETNKQFNFDFAFKETKPFFDFFFPDYYISDGSTAKGVFIPGKHKMLKLDVYSPEFRVRSNTWNGLVVNVSSNDSVLTADVGSQSFDLAQRLKLKNFTLESSIKDDSANFMTRWINWDTTVYRGMVKGNIEVADEGGKKAFHVHLNPSDITISDSLWHTSTCEMNIDTSGIVIDSLNFRHDKQLILCYGRLTHQPTDSLHFRFENFDLANLNFFTRRKDFIFSGVLNGNSHLTGLSPNTLFFSSMEINNLFVNNEDMGNCTISSVWDNVKQSLSVDAEAVRGRLRMIRLMGDYYPKQNGKMDFTVDLDKLKLDVFQPFVSNIFSDIRGLATGELQLTGNSGKPNLSGRLMLQKNAFTVNYLKTRYNFTTNLDIVNNNVLLENIKLYDKDGNSAEVNGIIRTEYLKDMSLNISINANDFLCLNTRSTDNEMYYGVTYATGNIKIKGPVNQLRFDINAKTAGNTRFYIPVTETTQASNYNFITFNRNDTSSTKTVSIVKPEIKDNPFSMQMDFNLDVTPDAELQLIFDSKIGDKITARGNGALRMSVNTNGTFELYGEYTIDKGDYLYTFQRVINRKLSIESGSTLRWTGDPFNAQVNITALYTTKASLSELGFDKFSGNTNVNCRLFLTGPLMNPKVRYDITLPNAEQDAKEALASALTTNEEVSRQVLSLLVMGRFYYPDASGSDVSSASKAAGENNAYELLSNQLSNWLSQLNDDVNLGVKINSGAQNNLSNQGNSGSTPNSEKDVQILLGTQMLNDKLIINGSVDMKTAGSAQNSKNNVLGDVDIDYKVTKNGKIRLKAFNHSNDMKTENITNDYNTQGFGVQYSEDFNTWSELFHRYWEFISGKKKKEAKKVPSAHK